MADTETIRDAGELTTALRRRIRALEGALTEACIALETARAPEARYRVAAECRQVLAAPVRPWAPADLLALAAAVALHDPTKAVRP